ncbi:MULTISPECIES: NUDIX domain-containing protein [Niastella]|uniref:NUDIX domain-containing protein n=1 Tax=Niastella soli TaxID=2821487 RepID=A0ABS3YW28_9BACT|nr:NUDIX domain-containing protein [Niastella soli]MBO9201371.1 NUDIX domain-containing protein [Niastella soli]
MKKQSAGILPYKLVKGKPFFFLGHPGGPFYSKKDDGHWSIVKGEMEDGEEPLKAAIREFKEETTIDITGHLTQLTPVKQKSGKIVHIWAIEQDFATDNIKSNTFTLEWPPKSGKMVEFPEMDRFAWFDEAATLLKLMPGHIPFVNEVLEFLNNKR